MTDVIKGDTDGVEGFGVVDHLALEDLDLCALHQVGLVERCRASLAAAARSCRRAV